MAVIVTGIKFAMRKFWKWVVVMQHLVLNTTELYISKWLKPCKNIASCKFHQSKSYYYCVCIERIVYVCCVCARVCTRACAVYVRMHGRGHASTHACVSQCRLETGGQTSWIPQTKLRCQACTVSTFPP